MSLPFLALSQCLIAGPGEAWIVGTREGYAALAAAVTRVLAAGDHVDPATGTVAVCAADGTAYHVHLTLIHDITALGHAPQAQEAL